MADSSTPDSLLLALNLKTLFTDNYCLLCCKNSLGYKHYKTKKHIKKVMRWIYDNSKNSYITHNDIEGLYCGACNGVFLHRKIAELHYSSSLHSRNSINYCKQCKKHIKSMDKHLLTKLHTELSKKHSAESDLNSSEMYVQKWIDHHTSSVKDSIKCTIEGKKNEADLKNAKPPQYEGVKIKNHSSPDLEKMVDKLYFSEEISLESVLMYLRNSGEDVDVLGSFIHMDSEKYSQQADTLSSDGEELWGENDDVAVLLPPKKAGASTTQEYSKKKLTMEISRLKLVLENKHRIPTHIAFQYVQNLNKLLDTTVKGEIDLYDIDVFIIENDNFLKLTGNEESEKILHKEIGILEHTLVNNSKISLETALYCITHFNVQLESLIENQGCSK